MFSQFLVETEILETDPPVNSPKSSKCSDGNQVGLKCQSEHCGVFSDNNINKSLSCAHSIRHIHLFEIKNVS